MERDRETDMECTNQEGKERKNRSGMSLTTAHLFITYTTIRTTRIQYIHNATHISLGEEYETDHTVQ